MSNQTGNSPEDKHLVKLVLDGNTNAFHAIIKNTEGLVAQIVSRMVTNVEDRRDIVQDIYMKAFHRLDSFKFQSKLSTWIGRIAYNACFNWLEKKKLIFPGEAFNEFDMNETSGELFNKPALTLEARADEPVLQKELSGILKTETEKLPPVYQTLIILYHQEELSYVDIVQITGLPEGTVKNYLFRARKMLKENLLSKYKKEAL